PKEKVPPGVLSAVSDAAIPTELAGRRKALAEWIVSPHNPLTARVMANRVWQWHFGKAIAGSPNNFGTTGKRPTHPELLDWLAAPRPEQRHRRTLYALKLRGLRDPFLEVFNQPAPETPCEARDTSTITPQAFALFNGQSTRDRALAFAARLLKETETKDEAIGRAFRLAFGRPPTDAESAACLKSWAAMTARHRGLTFEK